METRKIAQFKVISFKFPSSTSSPHDKKQKNFYANCSKTSLELIPTNFLTMNSTFSKVIRLLTSSRKLQISTGKRQCLRSIFCTPS